MSDVIGRAKNLLGRTAEIHRARRTLDEIDAVMSDRALVRAMRQEDYDELKATREELVRTYNIKGQKEYEEDRRRSRDEGIRAGERNRAYAERKALEARIRRLEAYLATEGTTRIVQEECGSSSGGFTGVTHPKYKDRTERVKFSREEKRKILEELAECRARLGR